MLPFNDIVEGQQGPMRIRVSQGLVGERRHSAVEVDVRHFLAMTIDSKKSKSDRLARVRQMQ